VQVHGVTARETLKCVTMQQIDDRCGDGVPVMMLCDVFRYDRISALIPSTLISNVNMNMCHLYMTVCHLSAASALIVMRQLLVEVGCQLDARCLTLPNVHARRTHCLPQ
jgi:hypothetical protein